MSSRKEWWFCLLILASVANAVMGKGVTTPTTNSSSRSECFNSGRFQECKCISGSNGGFMLQCQVEEDYFSVEVLPEEDHTVTLKIDCPCNALAGPLQPTSIFDYLSELILGPVSILHLNSCPLEQWSFSQWIDPVILQQLKLRSCHPLKDSLNSSFFQNLTQLNWLYLSSNHLTNLPEGLFKDLVNLKQLWLHDNQLEVIKRNHFSDLLSLRILQLGSNKIRTVEEGAFKDLRDLIQLNLEGNQLTMFSESLLQPLANLSILDLSNNQILNLETALTHHNAELTELGLRNNLFRTLPVGIFKNNLKLKKLFLQGNTELSNFSGDPFGNNRTASLEQLDLSSCNITTLNPKWFSSLGNLESLDLTRNRLDSLTAGVFSNLKKLLSLKLKRNELAFLESGAFRGLGSLKKLILRNNQLSTIPPDVLYPLNELEVIDLGRNQLSFSEIEAGLFYDGQSPLQNNLKLKSIDLSGNQINHIFSDWGNMNFLTELNLSYNNLTLLTFEDLSVLTSGIQLDVRHNQIRQINFDSAIHLDRLPPSDDKQMKRNGTPRKTVYLDGNPLLCDCLTYNLARYINRTLPGTQHSWDIEAPSLTCQEPESLRHLPPISVDPRLFVCPCLVKDDGSLCTCNRRPWDKAILQDCRPFNKTSIPVVTIPGYQLHLKLSADQISGLDNLTSGSSIVSLDLSWNEMSSIIFESKWWKRSAELFPNLKRLDLSYNLLRSIPTGVVNVWNEARQLALLLSGNQWDCDCPNRHILELPFGLRTRIEDYDRMACANGLPLPPPEVACPNVALRSVIVVVPLIAILILFVFAVVFRFRKELRVWMYNRNICLWCVTKKETDEDAERLYDAFVSFSHKDEDFVVQQLVPQLEQSESGDPVFRLCLHYRDWLAGERIPDQVSRSVTASKRTIVILSEHFLESMWGQLEFRTAYQQVLTDKCMRLIVIVMGDLPPKEKMDDELKTYLSLNTYLKWGDPWFWERLRYALPHKKSNRTLVEHDNKEPHRSAGSRLSQAIIEHGGDLQQPEGKMKDQQMNGAKLNHLSPLPLLTDRTQHRAHIILPPDIEMSITPTSSASSTAPIFPTSY